LTSGHSDAQGWASECPDVKNYKWRLNPVWHRMLYSCTRVATVGVKGLNRAGLSGNPEVNLAGQPNTCSFLLITNYYWKLT